MKLFSEHNNLRVFFSLLLLLGISTATIHVHFDYNENNIHGNHQLITEHHGSEHCLFCDAVFSTPVQIVHTPVIHLNAECTLNFSSHQVVSAEPVLIRHERAPPVFI